MNFANFEESIFFKRGQIVLNKISGDVRIYDRPVASYDATFYKNSFIDTLKVTEAEHIYYGLKPHLCFSLRLPLDIRFKNLIINQWLEVNSKLNSMNIEPNFGQFTIQGPGGYIPMHNHISNCKQILTFVYSFDDNMRFDASDYIGLEINDKTKEFVFPSSNKFFFTIKDNIKHRTDSAKWRFYWIYDFTEYIDISKINEFDYFDLDINDIK